MEKSFNNNKLETLRSILRLTNRDFAEKLGVHETQYTKMKKGTYPIGDKTINKLKSSLPEYNIEWLLYGIGEMKATEAQYQDNVLDAAIEILFEKKNSITTDDSKSLNINKKEPKLEAIPLRLADPYGFEATNEKIYKLPDDSLIMQVPIIPYKAYASYLRGHSDPEFYDGLQTMPVPVDLAHKGAYLIFEVGGDSMLNPGSRKSIWPGEKLIGRDLRRENWKYKLHINSTNCWIIVHKYDGIITKEIIHHDIDTAEITVHSWNPDKNEHPDYVISLNDVEQIFNVVDPFNKFG